MFLFTFGLLAGVIAVVSTNINIDYYLPSLAIDPRNKFFSCDDPTIRVQYNYRKIYMTCTNFEFNPFLRVVGEKAYEKLYYVKTLEEYNSCNATAGYPILICNGTNSKGQVCDGYSSTCSAFRLEHIEAGIAQSNLIDYKVGETYYFIATSYRTQQNIENKIGGSCSRTENAYEYRIRFKIYVCTMEEVQQGDCLPGKTLASYYKQCIDKCTEWIKNENEISKRLNGKCYIKEHRNCTNIDTEITTAQERDIEIQCPPPKCDEWKDTRIITKINESCTEKQTRSCINLFTNKTYVETQELSTTCPKRQLCTNWEFDDNTVLYNNNNNNNNNTCYLIKRRNCTEYGLPYEESGKVMQECPIIKGPLVSESVGSTESNNQNYLYIAIGASIAAFLLGLAIGLVCWFHNRKHPSEIVLHGKIPLGENGYTNKCYLPTIYDLPNGHIYEHANNTIKNRKLDRIYVDIPPVYHTALGRSISLQYTDENVFSGPDAVHYHTERARRHGRTRVNRNSSATSQTHLMRHFSDVSNERRQRITSYASSTTSTASRQDSTRSEHKPAVEVRHNQVDVIQEV